MTLSPIAEDGTFKGDDEMYDEHRDIWYKVRNGKVEYNDETPTESKVSFEVYSVKGDESDGSTTEKVYYYQGTCYP